jgi:hypothetical protein
MSIGKSVPNLISYLHELFQNFSQSQAIYLELISFGINFNSEIADEWARAAAAWPPRAAPTPWLKARPTAPPRPHVAFRQLASRPRASLRLPRPDSRRPDRRCPSHVAWTAAGHVARRRRAAVSTPVSRRPVVSRAPVPSRRRLAGQRTVEHAPLGRAAACTRTRAEREFGPVHPVNLINF